MTEHSTHQHEHAHGDTGQHWREPDRVRDFVARMDARAQERLPQFELMTQLLGRDGADALRILDLGAGYGAEASVFLAAFPNASAVLVDGSEEMIRIGSERLAEFQGRYRYVTWDFGDGALPDELDGPFDAVISSAAIHHLPEAALKRLYGEVLALLAPGGAFLNLDLVLPPDDGLVERYRELTRAEQDSRDEPPQPSNVRRHHSNLETLDRHLGWIREAGFEQVDCYWKRLGGALFGGYRPETA
ncbi:MAG: class I SAM-dependent methyltransferase [Chloroflexi bacterium]|nr:class I SAM-dependent methyltransferase [Chloroflexota bacterium]